MMKSSANSERLLEEYNASSAPHNVFVEMTFQDVFVEDCLSSLLSKTRLQDQSISKLEYVEFLTEICIHEGSCVEGDYFPFESINNNLQTLFLETACIESTQNRSMGCVEYYKQTGDEYGILADPDNILDIDDRVMSLCLASYLVIQQGGIWGQPTAATDSDVTEQPETPTVPTASPTLLRVTTSPTSVEQSTETTSSYGLFSSNDDDPYKLTVGAISIMICVGVVILFGVAVLCSGRSKYPNYDINQKRTTHVSLTVEKASMYDGNNVFHDEDTTSHNYVEA